MMAMQNQDIDHKTKVLILNELQQLKHKIKPERLDNYIFD